VQAGQAEDGHDGVADELLHRPAVPLEDVGAGLRVAVEHAVQALRVEPLAERRRAGQIAEDHRDRSPQALRLGRRGRRGR
jgi:hypothetical protein